MRRPAGPAALTLSFMLVTASAASPETDTRAIIEALTPPAQRASRNLVVRVKPAPEAASAALVAASAASAPEAASSAAAVADAPTAPAPAPEAVPAGPPASLALDIRFEPNSAQVRPESGALLGTLVAALQSPELKSLRFIIEGHADPRGSAAHNQRLSQERADEVRLYLVALGVHPSRLKAVGKGSTQLANAGDPQAAENRRVRVVTQP
ncbi:MAG: OmpA family protein [Rubrivivax sp.]|nr:OmpA family protein [Rubrivivax sp.]